MMKLCLLFLIVAVTIGVFGQNQDLNLRRTRPTTLPTTSVTDESSTSTTLSPEIVQCIRDCPVTPEYNPVCGTNNVTYNNPGSLACAQWCGVDVSMKRSGRC